MNNNEGLIKDADIKRISEEGTKIYNQIKTKYEPRDNGKFLAIEIDSKDVYPGDKSAEAVVLAKKEHPDKIFYIVRIGFDTAEMMVRSFINTGR